MLSSGHFMPLCAVLILLVTSSCALTSKSTTNRNNRHRQLITSVNSLQCLEYYLNEFDQEIENGNEVDMQIMIDGLSDEEVYNTFHRISVSVRSNRFIGVIQPDRTLRYRPEGESIKYDLIKFHVHNTKHDSHSRGSDGISSIEIAITKNQHLAIM